MAAFANNLRARPGRKRPGFRLGAAIGLGAAAVLPPIGVAALPGLFAALGRPPLAVLVVLAFAPASAGLAVLVFGVEGALRRLESAPEEDPRFAVFRVFAAAGLFANAAILGFLAPSAEESAWIAVVASAALVYAWLLLLQQILLPRSFPGRPILAIVADSGLVTLFLYGGGSSAAFAYPLYLLLAIGNGFRFGLKSLLWATLANAVGFAALVATTPFWRAQPALAVVLLLALMLLPASVARLFRRLTEVRGEPKNATSPALPAPSSIRDLEAESAKATTSEVLRLFADEARRAGEAVLRVAAAPAAAGSEPLEHERARAVEAHARALLSRLDDMRDLSLAAIAELSPENAVFDLYEVAFAALEMLRAEAAEKGRKLSLRVDPRLPYRLFGWSHQLRQILLALMAGALASGETGGVRLEIGGAGRDQGRVRYRIAIRRKGAPASGIDGFPILVRLVERMGGHLSADGSGLEIPFALAEEPVAEVDLRGRLVLIASEDREFSEDLLAWLDAFNARGETIGISETALRKVFDEAEERPVLFVDGRGEMLPALSFAYRAAGGGKAAVLFVVDGPQFDALAAIADDLLAVILPAPLTRRVLGAALHAVRAAGEDALRDPASRRGEARPEHGAAARSPNFAEEPAPVVTPITSHPRFAGERESVVEERTIAALRALGEGSDFFATVLDAFRTDSAAIFEELRRAAEAADGAGFREGLEALKSCAANVGGMRLVELLLSLRGVTAGELRLEGKGLVDRIGAELIRLEAALGDTLDRGAGAQ